MTKTTMKKNIEKTSEKNCKKNIKISDITSNNKKLKKSENTVLNKEIKDDKGITIKREDDSPEWYSQVIIKSKLADFSPVKGCMVIRPYGYQIWQNIQNTLNNKIQKNGVKNAYFPLFIPESFFKREAEHAEGFNPEVAWIENKNEEGERLAIRPTSETIMYDSYSKWIRSHRDLPLKINQWCNVVRWEVSDVKLFLRSREFLWQEGHCVYETRKECEQETLYYLELYRQIAEDLLAVPVMVGKKTEKEKFAGAIDTYTIEGFSPEGKAIQMGTSHNLSQGFARSFNISFLGKDDKKHIPWQNSWGISTRMIGAMVINHSDNKGLVLPPRVAPVQIIIIPIFKKDNKTKILEKAKEILRELSSFRVELDDSENYSSGWKFNEYELQGIPLRLEIGPKDIEKKQVVIVRRDTGEKMFIKQDELKVKISETLEIVQNNLFINAKGKLNEALVEVDNFKDFKKQMPKKKLIKAPFCGQVYCEEKLKAETKGYSSRLELINEKKPKNKACFYCGKPARAFVVFGRAY